MNRKNIDGKLVSSILKEELKEKVSKLDRKPGLVVISVGNDEASKVYVKQKEKMALYIGYNYNHLHFDDIEEELLINEINKLNNDNNVDGIIVQLPLPKKFNENKIVNTIIPSKDVDGLTYINSGKLVNNKDGLFSCTPSGIIELLKYYNVSIESKNCVVIGRSILVGKPMMNLLLNNNGTVTICHSKTKDLDKITRKADILVVAVGKPNFIKKDMIKRGSIIIDVGINRIDGKLYGDVDYNDCYSKAKLITPVPGGVGPMTVIMLMSNVYKAYLNK